MKVACKIPFWYLGRVKNVWKSSFEAEDAILSKDAL